MAYKITWQPKGTVVDCSGSFTIEELHEANGLLHGDLRFESHKYQIWNLKDADLSTITEDDMVQPAATDWAATLTVPRMKVALIVQEANAVQLCKKYIEKSNEFGSQWECRLFATMAEAVAWVET